MHIIKIVLLLILAALGVYLLVRLHADHKARIAIAIDIPAFLENPLPPETKWFGSNFVPFNHGQYKVRRKYQFKNVARCAGKEYMTQNCIWNGEKWLNTDGSECYFQDWSFQGLTERVES